FELQQAAGLSPVGAVAGGLDAGLPAPGLSLGFSRVFSNSIAGHYQEGPLGRGWYHSWQDSLLREPDGTVVIQGAAGARRRFAPTRRAFTPLVDYYAQPGDHGTLTNAPGGAYRLREANGLLRGFRADGKLDFVEDTNGNRITAGYTDGRLTSLTHSS